MHVQKTSALTDNPMPPLPPCPGKPFYPKLVDFLSSGAVVVRGSGVAYWHGPVTRLAGHVLTGPVAMVCWLPVGNPYWLSGWTTCCQHLPMQSRRWQHQLLGWQLGAPGWAAPHTCMPAACKRLELEHASSHQAAPTPRHLAQAMVFEGKDVVKTGRSMIGATNPLASAPGTIRGDYGIDMGRNIIHGSDR